MQPVCAIRTAPKKPFCILEILFICRDKSIWKWNFITGEGEASVPVLWRRALHFRPVSVSLRTPFLRCDKCVWVDRSVLLELRTTDDEHVLLLCAKQCVTKLFTCHTRCERVERGLTCSISCTARRSCFSWSTVESRRLWYLSASSWTETQVVWWQWRLFVLPSCVGLQETRNSAILDRLSSCPADQSPLLSF